MRDFPLLNKWLQISHLIGKDKHIAVRQSLFYSLISLEDVISSHLVWIHRKFSCAHFEGQTNGLFMHVFAQSCLMMACVGPMLWVLPLSRNNTPRSCLKYSWPGRPITPSHCGFLVVPSSPQFSYPLHVTGFHSLHPANLSATGCASHSRPAWSWKCHRQTQAHSEFLFSSVTFFNSIHSFGHLHMCLHLKHLFFILSYLKSAWSRFLINVQYLKCVNGAFLCRYLLSCLNLVSTFFIFSHSWILAPANIVLICIWLHCEQIVA